MSQVYLTQIPRVMRANHWEVAAQLMEKWFNDPANSDPFVGIPDTTTLKMDSWVLSFKRVRRIYEKMLSKKIWLNKKAQPVIVHQLKKQGKLGPQKTEFGDFYRPVPLIDKEYIQYRKVGRLWNPTDDLFAALGRLTLRMAIKGVVTPTATGGHAIHIKKVGIYVRDSYDFNGPQHLGYWNLAKNYGGKNFFRGTKVKNADFREWRTQQGRGGDYLVFSDIKIIQLEGGGDVFETQE